MIQGRPTRKPARLGQTTPVQPPYLRLTALHPYIVRDMDVSARITAKGQVIIPAAVRRALDLDKGDEIIFELDLGSGAPHAQVRKAADFMALAGSVPVPAEWVGADWPSLRAAAWSAQTRGLSYSFGL